MNQIVRRMANESDEVGDERLSSNRLNKVLVLKEEVHELTRACQMAKAGIINTNLLDSEELRRAVSEVATLPYANGIEALEYSMPSVYTNGSMLLYVISIPKIRDEIYNMLIVRPSIQDDKRIDLPFKKLLVNEAETYGITGVCNTFSNITVCQQEALVELEREDCIPKLLRGGQAECIYETKTENLVELLEESTLFVTNFNGSLTWAGGKEYLTGTYVIQLNNETVTLKNRTYTSVTSRTHLEALPAVLSNITSANHKVKLEYVHQLSLRNIKTLVHLNTNLHISMFTVMVVIVILIAAVIVLGRKIFSRTILPPSDLP
ncbi:uncharacterized protein [Musca autumnalis]|uniref:uncharacterized protein n=1 Tax=Musca autumnalis TaxID=221902 RepID=UPI003CEAE32C